MMHQRGARAATSHRENFARPFVPSTLVPLCTLGSMWWGAQQCRGIFDMILLTAFVISVLVGDLIAVGICWIIELFSKTASLLIFLTMFIGVIPLAWWVAVRVTEPEGPIMRRFSR
jgi:hypothetical protein